MNFFIVTIIFLLILYGIYYNSIDTQGFFMIIAQTANNFKHISKIYRANKLYKEHNLIMGILNKTCINLMNIEILKFPCHGSSFINKCFAVSDSCSLPVAFIT